MSKNQNLPALPFSDPKPNINDLLKPYASKIMKAFDFDDLAAVCAMETNDFDIYAEKTVFPSKYGDQFIHYIDRGSKVLAVAHLDSVQSSRKSGVVNTAAGKVFFSPVLDDRLGVYIALELLPKLGINVDVLLCMDEERGDSSAGQVGFSDFPRLYNWMVEFDRGGTDAVLYNFETAQYRELLKDCGWQVGHGTYTDICMLEGMGCMGMNVGVAYYDYHSKYAHCKVSELVWSLAKFMLFYDRHSETLLPHESYEDKLDNWDLPDQRENESDEDYAQRLQNAIEYYEELEWAKERGYGATYRGGSAKWDEEEDDWPASYRTSSTKSKEALQSWAVDPRQSAEYGHD